MGLPRWVNFGWKYLELLQKKDVSQGLNTAENSHFLSFTQVLLTLAV